MILDFVDSDGAGGNAPVVAKRYLWNDAVDQIFAQEDVTKGISADDRYSWLIQDRLNTVRDVLDRTGDLVAQIDYTSFGEVKSVVDGSGQPTALPTRYTFTGQERDSNTGLSLFGDGTGDSRWLNPAMSRFISRDVIPVSTQNGNLYPYVGNSPTNFIDPSGRERRNNLGPKVGLDDFNQPNLALPSSIDPSLDGSSISQEDADLALELSETAFDIAGIIDPTPACDFGGAVCAGARGDWKGVSISVVGFIPYFGDLAKIGKLANKVRMIQRVIDRMRDSAAFAERARPFLEKISKAIGDNIDCLPEYLSKPLKELKDKIDNLLADRFRRAPKNLSEELAMEEARAGAGKKIMDNLNDPRYKGMEKWQHVHENPDGTKTVIHYARDPKTGDLLDFKFKED